MEGYRELGDKLQGKLMESLFEKKINYDEFIKFSRGLSSALFYLELRDNFMPIEGDLFEQK